MDKKKKKRVVLPFALKEKIISDLDNGIMTRVEIMTKYDIRSDATLSNFRKQIKKGYRPYRYFAPELKIKYVNEILAGIRTNLEVKELLDLDSLDTVNQWIKKYLSSSEEIEKTEQMRKLKDPVKDEGKELQQARLKILALELLISTAEKELNYPIRKKFGTKQ